MAYMCKLFHILHIIYKQTIDICDMAIWQYAICASFMPTFKCLLHVNLWNRCTTFKRYQCQTIAPTNTTDSNYTHKFTDRLLLNGATVAAIAYQLHYYPTFNMKHWKLRYFWLLTLISMNNIQRKISTNWFSLGNFME